MQVKTPWVIIPGVIALTTVIAMIFNGVQISYSQEDNCLLQHLITNKEIIDNKIYNNELVSIDIFKNNTLTERSYYYSAMNEQNFSLEAASDSLDSQERIIKRYYFINETKDAFALSYFSRNTQKICKTEYYCKGNIFGSVLPPVHCMNPSTGI